MIINRSKIHFLPFRRLFAVNTKPVDQTYSDFADVHKKYVTHNLVIFDADKFTVFEDTPEPQYKFVPYEIKESTLKNGLGYGGLLAISHFFGYNIFINAG